MSLAGAIVKTIIVITAVIAIGYYLSQNSTIGKIITSARLSVTAIPIQIIIQNASHYSGKTVQIIGALASVPYSEYNLYDGVGDYVELNNIPSNVPLTYGANYSVSGIFGVGSLRTTCTTTAINCSLTGVSTGSSPQCSTSASCTKPLYYINVSGMSLIK